MSPIARRKFLQLLPAAMATAAWQRSANASSPSVPTPLTSAPPARNQSPQRPHYIVQIFLAGGVDPVLTVDPKVQDDVRAGIDCGYRGDERVRVGGRFYGPLIGGLLPHVDDLAFVHGVRTDTVAHGEGSDLIRSGRHNGGGSFAELCGSALPGSAPIPRLNVMTITDDMAPLLDVPIERQSHRPESGFARPRWFEDVERFQRSDAQRVFSGYSWMAERFSQRILVASRVHPVLADPLHAGFANDPTLGPALNFTFDALRYNVAKYYFVEVRPLWFDSHTDNWNIQRQRVLPAFADIGHFIEKLKSQRNEFGSLFEQTTIVINSELGRYPKLNTTAGKDHWPENSWVLAGKGVRRGMTVGNTDDRMQGVPVDYRSGRAGGGASRPVFLDALSATILQIAGADPTSLGFAREDVLQALRA